MSVLSVGGKCRRCGEPLSVYGVLTFRHRPLRNVGREYKCFTCRRSFVVYRKSRPPKDATVAPQEQAQ